MWRYFRRSSAPYCKVVESGLRCYPTTLLSFVIIFRWYLTTVLRFLHWASHGGCQQRSARRPFADRMKKEKKKPKGEKMTALVRQRVGIHQPEPSTLPQLALTLPGISARQEKNRPT